MPIGNSNASRKSSRTLTTRSPARSREEDGTRSDSWSERERKTHRCVAVSWLASQVFLGQATASLVHERQTIPLRVVDAFDDMEGYPRDAFAPDAGYGESLLVLSHGRSLRPNTDYDVVIDYLADGRSQRFNVGTWLTAGGPDTTPPRWKEAPFVEWRPDDDADEPDRDAPTIVVTLDAQAAVDLVVRVRPLRGGRERTLISPFDDDAGGSTRYEVKGRKGELCQRVHAFDWEQVGNLQRVTLTAVDTAGNSTQAPGAPLVLRWESEHGVALCLRR